MNTLTGIDFRGEKVFGWTKTTDDIYHSYTKNQLAIVRKWILFQNKNNYFSNGYVNALKILDMAIRNK